MQQRRLAPPRRVWLTIADHFEPWWRQPDERTALDRMARWSRWWPDVADRHRDTAGRPACYTFFYPEEQYHPRVLDSLAQLRDQRVGDVEVHLHHDHDTEQGFTDRMGLFLERLSRDHGLLHRDDSGIRFGFIHGNWALDNSLPGGRFCGLNNEITLLRRLGCYADFTLPSAPSPAQTSTVNTLYWATDDPLRPKSHDTGIALEVGGERSGDLMMIPGPLTVNLREWRTESVPKLETGELAGNAVATRHRARLWLRVAPRLGDDLFVKLFGHGAPEKNAIPLLEEGGMARALTFARDEATALGAELYFVSAWDMWRAVEAVRQRISPLSILSSPVRAAVPAAVMS
jgi:hypothetical protein